MKYLTSSHITYSLFKKLAGLYILYRLGKFIDFLFQPIAYFVNKQGFWFFEVNTVSFGHHLQEPAAVFIMNMRNKPCKKLIFLARKSKARVPLANKILEQFSTVIDDYTLFDPRYWLARNSKCGPVRDFYDESKLQIYYQTLAENMDVPMPFSCSKLLNEDVLEVIKDINPLSRPVIFWKPRILKPTNLSLVRTSTTHNFTKLFHYLNDLNYRIVSLTSLSNSQQYDNVFELSTLRSPDLIQRISLYFDQHSFITFSGQTGGAQVQLLMNKPMIWYDIAYPYSLAFANKFTLLHLKNVFDTQKNCFLDIPDLLELNSADVASLKRYRYHSISSEMAIRLFEEMFSKLRQYPDGFPKSSYLANSNPHSSIPMTNVYNKGLSPQIADCYYRDLGTLL